MVDSDRQYKGSLFCRLVGIPSFLSPSMYHSTHIPIHWHYPSSGPAPPSPFVANTVPDYFGGRPTPPPSPLDTRATLTVDDYAPCPPTPRYVPSGVHPGTSEQTPSGPRNSWFTSEVDHSTSFANPPTDETRNDPGHQARYDDTAAHSQRTHVSDHLIYSPETYAIPSPISIMMRRATLDQYGLRNNPVTPSTCAKPLKLFSLTGGHIPRTGSDGQDKQSFEYYAKRPMASPLRAPECVLAYSYPISCIQAVQRALRMDWSLVYPSPIPIIIIRSHDFIGPYALGRRLDGFAFVMPTEDSIWPVVRRRGVDSNFRPLDPFTRVETGICYRGDALYRPQHIVASDFAVNVFLEFPDSTTGQSSRCDYLGAYVLQVMENLTIHSSVWADMNPEVQRFVYNRVPYRFQGRPYLPYVRFCYYKWDKHIIGLSDEITVRESLAGTIWAADSDHSDSMDSVSDTDEDTVSTSNANSPEHEHTSFLDPSPSA